MADLDDALAQSLYVWVDKIPLSRVKRNIARDFSDGVLMAEVMKHFFPKFVNLHNYSPCHSTDSKKKNWQLLNWKVFKKLNFELSDDVIDSLVAATPGTIEKVLLLLKTKTERMVSDTKGRVYDCRPEADRVDPGYGAQVTIESPVNKARIRQPKYITRQPRSMSPVRLLQSKPPSSTTPQPNLMKHSHSETSRVRESNFSTSDYVSRMYYEDKVQECLTLEETVEILNAKIRRLEHLLRLKDNRIDELKRTLGVFRTKGRCSMNY